MFSSKRTVILALVASALIFASASARAFLFLVTGSPPISEVQVLGTQIGVGLSDTGNGQSGNFLNSTQAFTAVDWTATASTTADNVTTAPDATVTAGSLTETTANTVHRVSQGFIQAAAATQYTVCVSAKQSVQ